MATTLALLVVGCSNVDGNPQVARQKADELVAKADATGVGSNVTVDNAEALYGDSASSVCEIFDDGLNSAESLMINGNPNGTRTLTTEDSAKYDRLVVEVYCPQQLDEYDKVIGELRLASPD